MTPVSLFAFVNGQIVPIEQASVSSMDFGFLYGVGIFETFRTWQGRLFALERHLTRLQQSTQRLGWMLPFGTETLTAWVQQTVNANAQVLRGGHDLRLRLTVTPGVVDAERGWWNWTAGQPTVIIHAVPLPADFDRLSAQGWTAVIAPWRRPKNFPLLSIKSSAYFANLLARRYAKENGADEALWLNMDGNLTEGTATNFFIVSDGELWTPPASEGLLTGIARQIVMELAQKIGIAVREKPLPLSALDDADEAFVTNAVIGVMPLTKVEGRPLPSMTMATAFRERYLAEAQSASEVG